MKVATYNRKSVYSDHSDSVANQERMCRDHARLRFGDQIESFTAYQDEGFTGANTDRPGLKRLLSDIDAGKIDALVVYQLDRLSRSVKDFAEIYDRFQKKGVAFVSVKEQMDTETPMGRAMINITMVFAQMERETIAERVADNAKGLAMKGFWTRGKPPIGYRLQPASAGGKTHVRLALDEEGAAFVRKAFRDFRDLGKAPYALSEEYARSGTRGPDGRAITDNLLYKILTRELYCAADGKAYDWFKAKGCQMAQERQEWDGSRAVMVFGKRDVESKKEKRIPPSGWTVSIGMQEPVIPSDEWLAVQEQIRRNVFSKDAKYPPTLLKGLVRCASCGRIMNVDRVKRKGGGVDSYYVCPRRRSTSGRCGGSGFTRCEVLDGAVLTVLRRAVVDRDTLEGFYRASAGSGGDDARMEELRKRSATTERKLRNLSASLAEAEGSPARKYIIAEIASADAELCRLTEELERLEADARKAEEGLKDMEERRLTIGKFLDAFDGMDAYQKNGIMKDLFSSCLWDGEKLVLRVED